MILNTPEAIIDQVLLSIMQEKVGIIDVKTSEATSADYTTMKNLFSKAVIIISSKIQALDKISSSIAVKVENSILSLPDLSCLEPRGKFNVSLSNKGIFLEGKQCNILCQWENISHYCLVSSSTSLKKEGEDLLAWKLKNPVKCGNRDVNNLLITLSKNDAHKIDATRSQGEHIVGHESYMMTALVEELSQQMIARSKANIFQSIVTQKSYIRCYKGIQEGALYPLANGLLFVKPMIFIPAEEIASLSAGRGGASSSTKYIDIVIETADDKKIEFTNIEREELAPLQIYVKRISELQARSKQTSSSNVALAEAKSDADDSEEEEDNDDDDSSDDDSGDEVGAGKRMTVSDMMNATYDEDEEEDDDDYRPDDASDMDDDNSSDDSSDEDASDNDDVSSVGSKEVVLKAEPSITTKRSRHTVDVKIKNEPVTADLDGHDEAEHKRVKME